MRCGWKDSGYSTGVRQAFRGLRPFVRELFGALAEAGLLVSPPQFMGGISEVYPGDIWHRLVGRTIPKKSTRDGRRARKLILQALGITGLPELPTHDQNDACISALMAAAAGSKVSGMGVRSIGLPLVRDSGGMLREGPIIIPLPSDELRQTLRQALRELQPGAESKSRLPSVKGQHRQTSVVVSDSLLEKAIALRDDFIQSAKKGNAQICTYAWAYCHLFDESPSKWSQAYAKKVLSLAASTPLTELPTLGKVGLDTFIVSKRTGLPGEGHWKDSSYDREEWERVLGTATLLC
jgi:hypothetical protein